MRPESSGEGALGGNEPRMGERAEGAGAGGGAGTASGAEKMRAGIGWLRSIVWLAWLAYALNLFREPFLWHAEQFRNPGPVYFKIFLLAMPVWLLGSWLYALLRRGRRAWRDWELPVLVLAPACIGLAYEPKAVTAVAVLWVGAYGWGAALLDRMRIDLRSALERVGLPLVTGLVVWMIALFPLGVAGLLRPWVTVAMAAGGIWFGRRRLAGIPAAAGELRRLWREDKTLAGALAGYSIPWLGALTVMSALTALVPSRVWDALRHHIYDAMMYASWGALRMVPDINYSLFPQGVELMMATLLPFGGMIGAQLAAAMFFPPLLLLVYMTARECGATRAQGLLGIVLAMCIPAVNWSASVAKNDGALAMCLAGALYAYVRYLGEGEDRVMLWGAVLLAASLHVKHTAIFGGFALTLLYLHGAWRSKARLRLLAGVALIGLAIAPDYFARAAWYTGDPFSPQSAEKVVGGAVEDYQTKRSTGWRFVKVFEEIHFDGIRAWESTSTSKNPVGATPVILAPLLLLVGWSSRRWWAVAAFILIYYLSWASVLSIVRYIMVVLCLSAALLGCQFGRVWERSGNLLRVSLAGALCFCLTFGLWGTMLVEINAPVLAYFAKRISRDEYLSVMTQDYASLAAAVRMAGPEEQIHGLVNCAAAYAPNPARFTCDPCTSRKRCIEANVRKEIEAGRFRWLILSKRENIRHAIDPMVARGKAKVVFEDQYYSVFHLDR